MFRIANIDMMLPPPDALEAIEKWIDPALFVPWLRRSWPGFGLVGIAYPTGLRDVWIDYRTIKINRFYWPTGASRWAFGHFLAGADQTDKIRQAAYGVGGTAMNAVPFNLSCPGQLSVESLTTNLFVLACTPIGGLTGYQDFTKTNPPYLITLVDDRYYWWYKSVPDFMIDDTTAWSAIFSQIGTALGIAISTDTINAKYLQPSRGLNLPFEPVPPILDAACYNVGHRLIRDFAGNVSTQSFQTAYNSIKADFAAFPDRTIRAGGSRYLDNL